MIILYTTGCPKCKVLEKKLREKDIEYTVFSDVNKMLDMGFTNVPVLDVDGARMDFVTATKWINGKE